MTDAGHSADAAHASNDHGVADSVHGAEEIHANEEPLGPVDVQAWLAGVVGVAIGLLTAFCFVLATSGSGAY